VKAYKVIEYVTRARAEQLFEFPFFKVREVRHLKSRPQAAKRRSRSNGAYRVHSATDQSRGTGSANPRRQTARSHALRFGYRVIRIWNNDVIDNLDGILQTLPSQLKRQPLTPARSPQAGEGDKLPAAAATVRLGVSRAAWVGDQYVSRSAAQIAHVQRGDIILAARSHRMRFTVRLGSPRSSCRF
jgi:hypothetical protein